MVLRTIGGFVGALALTGAGAWAVTYAVPGSGSPLVETSVPALAAAPAVAAAPVVPAPVTATAASSSPASSANSSSATSVAPNWVADTAAASGVSPVAVAAYGQAVLTQPGGCHLGWTTLAGIGWVESEQGTVGGRYLEANGRPSTAILGPALDGAAFAAVPATPSSTLLHGDPRWDHAVGPMQFLPSTWEQWGRDGDGDGAADPQDLNDAAAAAVAYLCATGQDLTTGPGWSAAIFAYNHSDPYVQSVYSAATTYADRLAG